MDRWSEDDGGPRAPAGNVARLGMGGFVKSSTGYGSATQQSMPAIEVVASKREQKRTAAPEQIQPQPPRPDPQVPSVPAPSWAGTPPAGSLLRVIKDGAMIQEVPLNKAATLFGRGAAADVVCDHASLSRQHAQLCFKPATGQWLVIDLGSTHGTLLNGQRVRKDMPAEFVEGSNLQFGASTRLYMLQYDNPRKRPHNESAAQNSKHETQPAAGSRVHFADKAKGGQGLEQIIGYSDGRSFAVNVGPVASDGELKGQFEDLVKPRTLEASISSKNADQVDGIRSSSSQRRPAQDEKRQRRVQPLQPQLSSGLYDLLPHPSMKAAEPG